VFDPGYPFRRGDLRWQSRKSIDRFAEPVWGHFEGSTLRDEGCSSSSVCGQARPTPATGFPRDAPHELGQSGKAQNPFDVSFAASIGIASTLQLFNANERRHSPFHRFRSMGVRLKVRKNPEARHASDMIAEAVLRVPIQVPPSGKPIFLLEDAKPSRGYPKMAHVIHVDLSVSTTSRRRSRPFFPTSAKLTHTGLLEQRAWEFERFRVGINLQRSWRLSIDLQPALVEGAGHDEDYSSSLARRISTTGFTSATPIDAAAVSRRKRTESLSEGIQVSSIAKIRTQERLKVSNRKC